MSCEWPVFWCKRRIEFPGVGVRGDCVTARQCSCTMNFRLSSEHQVLLTNEPYHRTKLFRFFWSDSTVCLPEISVGKICSFQNNESLFQWRLYPLPSGHGLTLLILDPCAATAMFKSLLLALRIFFDQWEIALIISVSHQGSWKKRDFGIEEEPRRRS